MVFLGLVGFGVGATVGATVGDSEGASVGVFVGASEGSLEGSIVGPAVGEVGELDGSPVCVFILNQFLNPTSARFVSFGFTPSTDSAPAIYPSTIRSNPVAWSKKEVYFMMVCREKRFTTKNR